MSAGFSSNPTNFSSVTNLDALLTATNLTPSELRIAADNRIFYMVGMNEIKQELFNVIPTDAFQIFNNVATKVRQQKIETVMQYIQFRLPSIENYESQRPYLRSMYQQAEKPSAANRPETCSIRKRPRFSTNQSSLPGEFSVQVISPFSPLWNALGCSIYVNLPFPATMMEVGSSSVLASEYLKSFAGIPIMFDTESMNSTSSQAVTCAMPPAFQDTGIIIIDILKAIMPY